MATSSSSPVSTRDPEHLGRQGSRCTEDRHYSVTRGRWWTHFRANSWQDQDTGSDPRFRRFMGTSTGSTSGGSLDQIHSLKYKLHKVKDFPMLSSDTSWAPTRVPRTLLDMNKYVWINQVRTQRKAFYILHSAIKYTVLILVHLSDLLDLYTELNAF